MNKDHRFSAPPFPTASRINRLLRQGWTPVRYLGVNRTFLREPASDNPANKVRRVVELAPWDALTLDPDWLFKSADVAKFNRARVTKDAYFYGAGDAV